MKNQKILLSLILLSTVTFCPGCILVAVGIGAAGTIAYTQGDLKTVESENIDLVYAAAVQAVEELQFVSVFNAKDALSAEISCRDAQDKKVRIKLNAVTESTTKISIRIGTFGNETKSRLIYQQIHDILKAMKTAPESTE